MSISRTGTYTTEDGESKTYHYGGFTTAEITSGSDGFSGTSYYSNDDLNNESIFANTESEVTITFTDEVNPATVVTFTKDVNVPDEKYNKKGTFGLTHVVRTPEAGANPVDNGLEGLKLSVDGGAQSVAGVYDQTGANPLQAANDEFVEMTTLPTTEDNISFTMTPVANLSSNTTYFFRMDDENVFDVTGHAISYDIEKGFVTDNSRSFVTTGEYYSGFTIQTEGMLKVADENQGPLVVDENLVHVSGTQVGSYKIKKIDSSTITYQLNEDAYQMNCAYTATNPVVITNVGHGLADNDIVQVYDMVSGNAIAVGSYVATELTSDTFSIPVDGTTSGAGRLNYYRNLMKGDQVKCTYVRGQESDGTGGTTYVSRKKIVSVPQMVFNTPSEMTNNTFNLIKQSDTVTTPSLQGKLVKFNEDDNVFKYVATTSAGAITSDSFANNTIIDLEGGDLPLRIHIKANTYPTHNIHPFNSSAPKVEGTFPEDGESFPRKLTVSNILRRGKTAIIETNHPHNLSKGDEIKILGSTNSVYNLETKVLAAPTANTLHYELTASSFIGVQSPAPGPVKIQTKATGSFADAFNAIIINFSQSMNTSTISVSNSSHIISADGSSAVFAGEQDSASSTVQMSDDGFENIEQCVSITPSKGNSSFALLPSTIKRNHSYKIRVTDDVQDLGKTNLVYQYESTEGIDVGLKIIDPKTGQSTIYSRDEDPPEIKKISISSTAGTAGFAGKVLESKTASEISSPSTYQDVDIDLDTESIIIQFTEEMNIASVTTATSNTTPVGTVQLSCDSFNTVVQMTSTSPVVSKTEEENDTFTFTPVANLAGGANYTLKVSKGVSDGSPKNNQMAEDNVTSSIILTLNSTSTIDSTNTFVAGEIINGLRTISIKSNTNPANTPIDVGDLGDGVFPANSDATVTLGDEFIGLTSKGKGKVFDYLPDAWTPNGSTNPAATNYVSAITSMRYTEIPGLDGTITKLIPGETCRINATHSFVIDNVAITPDPEGEVISVDLSSSPKTVTYRNLKVDADFITGSTTIGSSSDRIIGRESNGHFVGHESTKQTGPGFKMASTAVVSDVKFANTDGDVVSILSANQNSINCTANFKVGFTQTMNVDSLNYPASSLVPANHDYNIIFSYDSSFKNAIPFDSITGSNNDTSFELRPAILANTSLNLTQNSKIYATVTDTAKSKGGTTLASTATYTTYYANTASNHDFKAIQCEVMTYDGQIIELGVGGSGSMPNQSSIISRNYPIVIHFNEAILLSTFAIGSGNEIELSTASGFGSGHFTDMRVERSGEFGNKIVLTPTTTTGLAASTQYYIRVVSGVGGTNETGVTLASTVYFNSFTTTS